MNTITRVAITIECIHGPQWKQPIIVWNTDQYTHTSSLFKDSTFEFNYARPDGDHAIEFSFVNKTNEDSGAEGDMALIIKDISINGISDVGLFNHTTYTPDYPEPWLSQQEPKPKSVLHGHRYLGWNGTWRFDFSTPAYQWLHQAKQLGWTY